MDHATLTRPDTAGMPAGFPYPDAPPYSTGQYGDWTLYAKPEATYERGYFTGFGVEPPGHYLVRDGHIWMSDSRLERESHALHLKHAAGSGRSWTSCSTPPDSTTGRGGRRFGSSRRT
jgi:hypothetical protein